MKNQFDMLMSMPGGLAGVSNLIKEFHTRNISVMLPYNPWDVGTASPPLSNSNMIAQIWKQIDADGFFGDTMEGIAYHFFNRSVALDHPIVLEPELGVHDGRLEMLQWNVMSWAYWNYKYEPLISKYKWLVQRHKPSICDRWATNRTDDIQHAFFNFISYTSWYL